MKVLCNFSRSPTHENYVYINNSLHLARKYAQIFVCGHYLSREANSFSRAKLVENCERRGTGNVQEEISEHIFKAKWRLLWLLSFKYFSCSNELEYLNISFKNSLPSKTYRAYVVFRYCFYRPVGLSLLLSQEQTVPPSRH